MKKVVLICAACALLTTACTTPGKRTAWGAAGGAAVGALTGAIIANNTGGQSHQGAIYGALAGATAGGALGNYYDKQAKELAATKALVWPLFYTGVFYLVFVGILTIVLGKIEKKLSYFRS